MNINVLKACISISLLVFSNMGVFGKPCDKRLLMQIKQIKIWTRYDSMHDSKIIAYTSGMAIDADGSPHAYNPCDSGLNALGNAGSPGHWFGIYTRKGIPWIQSDTCPAPGFYISITSLQDKTKNEDDPARYIDAEKIPYIVLPPILSDSGMKLGDIALVINTKNDSACYAIFADIGPKNKIGEGSIELAKALGINSSPRNGGADDGVIYILFPGSGDGKPKNMKQIKTIGEPELKKTGGKEKLLKYVE